MTSSNDLPAGPAGGASPALGSVRVRGRRAAALLAAAAPLAAAALAAAPSAAAFASAAPPTASTSRPSHTLAAELLTTRTLPATTARTGGGDPKIPEAVGD
jgi:hypothetical protein